MVIEPDLPIKHIERNKNTTIFLFRIIKKYNKYNITFSLIFYFSSNFAYKNSYL